MSRVNLGRPCHHRTANALHKTYRPSTAYATEYERVSSLTVASSAQSAAVPAELTRKGRGDDIVAANGLAPALRGDGSADDASAATTTATAAAAGLARRRPTPRGAARPSALRRCPTRRDRRLP